MPKSRHHQFLDAFEEFFEHSTLYHYPGITKYKLDSITTNKSCNDHTYTLRIPKKDLSYTIESNNENIVNERVYRLQELPNSEDFKDVFREYFEEYALVVDNVTLSYVNIFDYIVETDDNEEHSDDDLNFLVQVFYNKSHMPFPVKLTKMQELNNRIKQLEKKNVDLAITANVYNNRIQVVEHHNDILRHRLRKERREMHTKYIDIFGKMQQKFRDYYECCDKKEECPVCYETMDASKLIVPTCTHFICSECSQRCSSCPLCRDTYV
jgi:hypothetical protein